MRTRRIFMVIVVFGIFGLTACASAPRKISEPREQISVKNAETQKEAIPTSSINGGQARFYFALKNGDKEPIQPGEEVYFPFDAVGIVTEFEFPDPVQVEFRPEIDGEAGPVLRDSGKRIFENVLNIRAAGLDRSLQVSGQITGPDGETKNFTGPVLLFRGRKL